MTAAMAVIVSFQSTLLLRGATTGIVKRYMRMRAFNPRSSCESDLGKKRIPALARYFQSTLLLRGATSRNIQAPNRRAFFNPRSSCEERPYGTLSVLTRSSFSIHAPLARSDHRLAKVVPDFLDFSIHAPLARSDKVETGGKMKAMIFNPRSSCEERHADTKARIDAAIFSIHAPLARSDDIFPGYRFCSRISIHAPLARSDCDRGSYRCGVRKCFNPRSSCEERPLRGTVLH